MVEPGGEEERPLLDSAQNDCPPRKALPALCDPRRLAHRLLVLALMCFLGFGKSRLLEPPQRQPASCALPPRQLLAAHLPPSSLEAGVGPGSSSAHG